MIQLMSMPSPDWANMIGSGQSVVVLQRFPGSCTGHFFSVLFPRGDCRREVQLFNDNALGEILCCSMALFDTERQATPCLSFFLPIFTDIPVQHGSLGCYFQRGAGREQFSTVQHAGARPRPVELSAVGASPPECEKH